jgi:hypothetical protein
MSTWLSAFVSIVVGLVSISAAHADETAKKVRAAIDKIEGSVVGVRYSRDMSGFEDIQREGRRGGRGGRAFMRTLGGPRVTSGIITNADGFVVVPANITQDPTRNWGWMRGERPSPGVKLKDVVVILPGGEEREARLAGRDSNRNLAFLQLKDKAKIKPVALATKGKVELAEQVIIVAPLSDREAGTLRFLLTRINAIVEGDSPYYSVMDDLGPYEGGLVANLRGEVIGMVGTPPAPKSDEDEDEGEDILRGVRRFVGGRATGLRVIPSASLEEIFAKPPTGLLPLDGEEEEGDDGEEVEPRKEDEGKKDDEGKKKPEEDY